MLAPSMKLDENPRAVLVGVQLPDVADDEHRSSLDELGRLAHTLGLEVIGRVSQKRSGLSRAAVVGEGKLRALARYTGGDGVVPSAAKPQQKKMEYIPGKKTPGATALDDDDDGAALDEDAEAHPSSEALEIAEEGDADEGSGEVLPPEKRAAVVLVDHDITPSQARNLERAVDAEVLDRTAVILSIFQRHARTREAKIEVEIARLAYMAPRLREVGGGGDRQRGGIGGRGAGESSMELDRRKVRDRIAELRRELDSIEQTARTRRSRRAEESTVALVGYTNAGKSSLMRGLTGSEVYVADKLFATLDTTVRVLKPESKPRILVSDTVGFIKKLPHGLVASFRATLEAAGEADLLLHVVDASDPAFEQQMQVTRDLLTEIGAHDAPFLLLLNKIDKVDEARRADLAARYPDAFEMSAKSPKDVLALRDRIVAFFEQRMVDGELEVPWARHGLVAEIHARCRVLHEEYLDEGTKLTVRADPGVLGRLQQMVAAERAELPAVAGPGDAADGPL
ncbi:GTPase HflX [Myxococcota bacterium]|nr:GTPase HflX [Myxococcota bacterium]